MEIKDFDDNKHLLFKCIAGSRAYGLDTPSSDTDIKGVFVFPREDYYGLDYEKQINNDSHDIVFYELKRFFQLLLVNNPSILEFLAIPEDCILYKHPLFDLITPHLVLSKLCKDTFAGYAMAQIKRAKGLNKKIMNPMDKERLGVLDFCYVIQGQGSIPLRSWLTQNGFRQEYCGLVNIPHMKDVYSIFYDHEAHRTGGSATLGFQGITKKKEASNVSLSSIPKEIQPAGHMAFNTQAFSKYCKDYKEYWDWVEKRNDARYKDTVAHGKNYDAKNMMHTFRLLDMAEEIARYGKLIIRRPNRGELLAIKSGQFLYNDLVSKAEERIETINNYFDKSSLPGQPDKNALNRLLVEIRDRYYA